MSRQPKRKGAPKRDAGNPNGACLQIMVYASPDQKAAVIEQMEHERLARPGLSMSNTLLMAVLQKAARRRRVPMSHFGPLPMARKRTKS